MKEKKKSQVTYKGVGFGGLLTIVFIVLKLIGYFPWSWIWVFAPLVVSGILTVLIIIALLVVAVVSAIASAVLDEFK